MPELGKYAVPVLGAYGVAIAVFGVLIAATIWRSRLIKQRLDDAERRRADG